MTDLEKEYLDERRKNWWRNDNKPIWWAVCDTTKPNHSICPPSCVGMEQVGQWIQVDIEYVDGDPKHQQHSILSRDKLDKSTIRKFVVDCCVTRFDNPTIRTWWEWIHKWEPCVIHFECSVDVHPCTKWIYLDECMSFLV
jgi:hypothetical protein